MACNKEYETQLHKYLDGEMIDSERTEFHNHLDACEECAAHYKELKKAVMLVQSSSHIEAPEGFTEAVMERLPVKKKRKNWKKWMRQHPILVAASLFVFLMTSSVLSVWVDQSGEELTVIGSQDVEIDRDNGMVVVPEGEIVEGDLFVKNGRVEVEGEITGDLTVINGDQYLASAGKVSGEIEEVDQALEWIWYHTKRITSDVFSFGEEKNNE
ncbi:anti-sigma factor family protein [Alteribacillus bidgolensis]|uniref:Anti-sigma-W factor RsiW n=1 Tax=Alteribacillus bidgolensis TaxID=930129 RepID=A0A1G8QXG3_9BACI|nr:anti-sigma factor [Alteribacillus bidgolensis]SDJ09424.1 anti-sigma factor, TIGR02949 family [Alteribacillus bidgolensis]